MLWNSGLDPGRQPDRCPRTTPERRVEPVRGQVCAGQDQHVWTAVHWADRADRADPKPARTGKGLEWAYSKCIFPRNPLDLVRFASKTPMLDEWITAEALEDRDGPVCDAPRRPGSTPRSALRSRFRSACQAATSWASSSRLARPVPARPSQHAQLPLHHVQPTGVLGRGVEFQSPPLGLVRREGREPRRRGGRVPVVQHPPDRRRLGVPLVPPPPPLRGAVGGRPPFGHRHPERPASGARRGTDSPSPPGWTRHPPGPPGPAPPALARPPGPAVPGSPRRSRPPGGPGHTARHPAPARPPSSRRTGRLHPWAGTTTTSATA